MKPKEEGRNCNLQISLIANANIYGESYVLSIKAEPLVGHITESINVYTVGLGEISEEEAFKTYKIAKDVMYAVQSNPNIKFIETKVEEKPEVKKMKFEIINYPDKAYIKGTFEGCALATIFIGEGKYALKQVDGTNEMPLTLFNDSSVWTIKQFNKTIDQLFDENKQEIVDALMSVYIEGEQLSLSGIVSYAHELGEKLKKRMEAVNDNSPRTN